MKQRLDMILVQNGLAPSREKAKAMIMPEVLLMKKRQLPWRFTAIHYDM